MNPRPAELFSAPGPVDPVRARDVGSEWTRPPRSRCPPGAEKTRLAVQVTPLDPLARSGVETRILVDGMPVIAAGFEKVGPYRPEYLLGKGLLRATEEPREIALAEAWCTEGCCGALRVTIVREGDTVRWRDWSRPAARRPEDELPELPEFRFAAAQYDAEIARAEAEPSRAAGGD